MGPAPCGRADQALRSFRLRLGNAPALLGDRDTMGRPRLRGPGSNWRQEHVGLPCCESTLRAAVVRTNALFCEIKSPPRAREAAPRSTARIGAPESTLSRCAPFGNDGRGCGSLLRLALPENPLALLRATLSEVPRNPKSAENERDATAMSGRSTRCRDALPPRTVVPSFSATIRSLGDNSLPPDFPPLAPGHVREGRCIFHGATTQTQNATTIKSSRGTSLPENGRKRRVDEPRSDGFFVKIRSCR